MIATVCGVGRIGKMPGTLGTLAACLALLLAGGIPVYVLAATIVIGTIAADRYAKEIGREDPGEIVIDEVAGYWLAMYGLAPSYAIVVFFLFRVVDILKPFPVNTAEKLPGGVGIMADDLVGGAVVNLLIRLLWWLFFAGGFDIIYRHLGIGG